MDIVTHALVGGVLAAPFLQSHPGLAGGFLLGSVLPDMDALSRVGGKEAFLRAHQTWSHAIPIQVAAGLGFAGALAAAGAAEISWTLPLGIAAGAVLHTLLDLTNTYGVTALAPFTTRRMALEWIFFIDAGFLLLLAPGLATAWRAHGAGALPPSVVASGTAVLLAAWVGLRAVLRRRAGRLAPPGTRSLIPSALVPWVYFGYAAGEGGIRTFRLDGLTGAIRDEVRHEVHDGPYREVLEGLAEFRIMRDLSPAYHVVEARAAGAGTRLVCRDLRTRNFGGVFGTLEVDLDAEGAVGGAELHV